jgi:hypothetical protein
MPSFLLCNPAQDCSRLNKTVTGRCSKGTWISSPGSQLGPPPAKPLRLLSGSSLSAIATVRLLRRLATPAAGLRLRRRGAAAQAPPLSWPPGPGAGTTEWTPTIFSRSSMDKTPCPALWIITWRSALQKYAAAAGRRAVHLLRGAEERAPATGLCGWRGRGRRVASAESGGAGVTSTRGGWAGARCPPAHHSWAHGRACLTHSFVWIWAGTGSWACVTQN